MIPAVKADPQGGQATTAKPAKDFSSQEAFDPMLASLVAQLLQGFQIQAPKAGAPPAPPRSTATPRVEAPPARLEAATTLTDAIPTRPTQRTEAPEPQGQLSASPDSDRPAHEAEAAPEPEVPSTVTQDAPVKAVAPQRPDLALPVPIHAEAQGEVVSVTQVAAPGGEMTKGALEAATPVGPREVSGTGPAPPQAISPRLAQEVETDDVPAMLPQIPVAPVQVTQPRHLGALAEGAPLPTASMVAAVSSPVPEAVGQAPGTPLAPKWEPVPTATSAAPLAAPASTPTQPLAAALEVLPQGGTQALPVLHSDDTSERGAEQALPGVPMRVSPAAEAPIPVQATFQAAVREAAALGPQSRSGDRSPAPHGGVVQAVGPTAPQAAAKVAAPAAAMKPHPVLTQVEGSIRWILKHQEKGAELQLHPESLGKVQIKLTVEGQQVHAKLWASEAGTVPILQDHRAFLEVSLREQGLTLGNFELQFGQRGQDAQAPRQEQPISRGIALADDATTLQEVPVSVPAALLGAYRIEVFA